MWWSSVTTNILLFLLIFGISGTVDVTSFRSRLQDYKSLVVGVGCQFVILPLVGFAVVRTLQLPPMYGLVLLVVVSSPGGSYSNWWCSLCNADLALSVAMTTISTIASVGLLPLNILVYVNASYDEEVRISWAALLIPILVVVCAIFLGLYAGLKMPHRRNQLNALGNVCGIALIAIGAVFNGNSDVPLWSHSRIFYIAVGMPCILGAILSFALSASLRINKPAAVAITIEVCYQNTGIALTVALSTFDEQTAAIAAGVPLFYALVQVVLIASFALLSWRMGWTYCEPKVGLVRCVTTDYQPHAPVADEADAGNEEAARPASPAHGTARVAPLEEPGAAPVPAEMERPVAADADAGREGSDRQRVTYVQVERREVTTYATTELGGDEGAPDAASSWSMPSTVARRMMAQLRLPALPVRPMPPADPTVPVGGTQLPPPRAPPAHPLSPRGEAVGSPKLPPISPGAAARHAGAAHHRQPEADRVWGCEPAVSAAAPRHQGPAACSRSTHPRSAMPLHASDGASALPGSVANTGSSFELQHAQSLREMPIYQRAGHPQSDDTLDVDAVPVRRGPKRHASVGSLNLDHGHGSS